MTIDRLRAAIRRALRSYGIPAGTAGGDFLDELVAIADHHAAEEVAATVAEREPGGAA